MRIRGIRNYRSLHVIFNYSTTLFEKCTTDYEHVCDNSNIGGWKYLQAEFLFSLSQFLYELLAIIYDNSFAHSSTC